MGFIRRLFIGLTAGIAAGLFMAVLILPVASLIRFGDLCGGEALGRCLSAHAMYGLLIYGPLTVILGLVVVTPLAMICLRHAQG